MTLVCVPTGRGNWKPMTLRYDGRQALPLLARVGERFMVLGVTWRVSRILP